MFCVCLFCFFFLMLRRPPRSTLTDTLFPYTTLFRSARSSVKYDLLGKVSEATDLLRQTVAEILSGIEPSIFEQYRANPEHFISEAARLIKEQKAGHLIEQLVYDPIDERYDADIFTAAEIRSEEHTSELQSLMRSSYAVFCLKKKRQKIRQARIR